MLEQAAVAEAVPETQLEAGQLLRQWHDQPATDLFAMTVYDPNGFLCFVLSLRDVRLAHRVDRERKQRGRRSRRPYRLDAMAVEQRLDDARLDVRGGVKDNGQSRHGSDTGRLLHPH